MERSLMKSLSLNISPGIRESIAFALQLLCIFLFLYTGYSKFKDHARFEAGLARVEIIGRSAGIVSWLVPLAEGITSILIAVPATSRKGLTLFIALMSLFSIYIIYELLTASKLPCHCGGIVESLTWRQHLWFNLGCICVAIAALRLNRNINVKK